MRISWQETTNMSSSEWQVFTGKLTKPIILKITARSLENVNLSAEPAGNKAASKRVKTLEDEESRATVPASVYASAAWNV